MWSFKGKDVKNNSIDPDLYSEVKRLGAKDMEACMQCGNCSASCPLSRGDNPFPRKIYRYLQLGLRDRLLAAPEPWLCYYCGECNTDCPRGAEPAETMMAVRRWLTTQYDWTGLAKRFYLSEAWEFGALGVVALFVTLLFVFFHGPIITDRMAVNTFAPVFWVEVGDLTMAAVLSAFLMSNAFRMYRFVMDGTKAPLSLYLSEAKSFLLHFMTQKRWRECGDDKSRWLKHFFLVSGYLTMLTLIIVFLHWFQVDDTSWHFSSIFGYYATGALLCMTVEMFRSRLRKQETIHRYSHASDWLFLILLFLTTLTGIMMHIFRLADWPIGTYVIYVIHLAIAVPMLVIEVPFGKWSHLFYRPFAIYLAAVKEKASQPSVVDFHEIKKEVGDAFMTCMQCGTCTSICPSGLIVDYSPRMVMRSIALERATTVSVDEAAWSCVTCNNCVEHCPRGIGIVELIKSVRKRVVDAGGLPAVFADPVKSLKKNGNPWQGKRENRLDWAKGQVLPPYSQEQEYCLFSCCTTAYDNTPAKGAQKGGIALLKLLQHAGVSYGSLGTKESCCGDMVDKIGAADVVTELQRSNTEMFKSGGVKKILTISPHCMNTFKNDYQGLKGIATEHYTELLDRLIHEGGIKPGGRVEAKVTYHDPCYLGRHGGIYDAPRRILGAIPGIELLEMQNSKERSFCCGGGGGGQWNEAGKDSLGEIRVKEALGTGAAIIATACPYCIRMLNDAIVKLGAGKKIHVQDITELLLQSVDLSLTSGKPGINNRSISQEDSHV